MNWTEQLATRAASRDRLAALVASREWTVWAVRPYPVSPKMCRGPHFRRKYVRDGASVITLVVYVGPAT